MLPDHASEPDARALPIDQVGIGRLSYPITVWDKARQRQDTVAQFQVSVGLPADFKGTHMSRFLEILEGHRGELSLTTVPDILAEVQRRLEADDAYLDVAFPYFLERTAPVSGARSLMEYKCRFRASRKGDELDFVLCVDVPVTTLCPCSKAVSRYGAHNQRGIVSVELRLDDMVWIEDVVAVVEAQASSPLYALLKREDEKYVTEKAYENPRFVEDLVRDCVIALRELPGVSWLTVEVENLESIHNHSAWARVVWPGEDVGSRAPARRFQPRPFGELLKSRRESQGLSQRGLATRAGISPSILSRIEAGLREPSDESIAALAKALGVDATRMALAAGRLSPELIARIQADPEGFLAWSRR
ncbi:MAG: GTP cyclohydrolase I FolE2 [Proteobacteria bacterium]|nr:GTP cyclohydrolase I FolE2 [Pseudomonadota bacterium]MCP4921124.1 GTP cyclohydrolase I FolE2 [Pseudomonadota bacterium]